MVNQIFTVQYIEKGAGKRELEKDTIKVAKLKEVFLFSKRFGLKCLKTAK